MSRVDVSIIGIGRMGAAMVGRLRRQGRDVVIYNRTTARSEEVARLTGATVAASAAEAAAAGPIVISCLADDAAVKAAFLGPDGIAAGLAVGTVVLEMSTIDPKTVHLIRPEVESKGAALLDAPVSGSVALVEAGTLTVMAGGDPVALDRARPLLTDLAARVFHMGVSGSGATMKLAVNSLVHAVNVGLSEALVLAELAGVERELAYDVFSAGAAGAPFVHYKRGAFLEPDS